MSRILSGQRRSVDPPSGRQQRPVEVFDLRGLDQTTPHDIMDDAHSPYLRNARMYARDDENRRVAIRTRRGQGFYSDPVGESQDTSQESTTGAGEGHINTSNWVAETFSPSVDGRLTKVELRVKNPGAIGSIICQVNEDNNGEPGDKIAVSSVTASEVSEDFEWITFRFIDAPLLTSTDDYWITAHLQAGQDNYLWSSTEADNTGLVSNTGGNTWQSSGVSYNYRTHLSDDGAVRGVFRYDRANGESETLFVHGSSLYSVDEASGAVTEIVSNLDDNSGMYHFDAVQDKAYFVNSQDAPKVYDGNTVEEVGAPANASSLAFHKDRLFIVRADDPTRVDFSDPGDYDVFQEENFFHVPSPDSPDRIQRIISFQDVLVILCRNSKYALTGSDLATFELTQTLGTKGATNTQAVDTDENFLYFASDDGFYRWNGAEDEYISDRVANEFRNVATPERIHVRAWQDEVRIYYASSGSPINDRCLIWDTVYEEWFLDDDVPINSTTRLLYDNDRLVEASDRVGQLYLAEQQFSLLGKPMRFEYRSKHFSFGNSAAKKQVRRFYPLFRGQASPYDVTVAIDKDMNDDPIDYQINTQQEGAIWGEFNWGDGTTWGATTLVDPRLTIPGQSVYFQFRFIKEGAETPVELLGYMAYPRLKRPK